MLKQSSHPIPTPESLHRCRAKEGREGKKRREGRDRGKERREGGKGREISTGKEGPYNNKYIP